MNANHINTPRTVCRAIIATAVVAAAFAGAALALGCGGCASSDARRAAAKAEIAAVMRLAYEAGGRDLVDARIDRLVAEGKVTEEQADCLRAVAQAAYERAVDRLAADGASGGGDGNEDANCGACADCTATGE